MPDTNLFLPWINIDKSYRTPRKCKSSTFIVRDRKDPRCRLPGLHQVSDHTKHTHQHHNYSCSRYSGSTLAITSITLNLKWCKTATRYHSSKVCHGEISMSSCLPSQIPNTDLCTNHRYQTQMHFRAKWRDLPCLLVWPTDVIYVDSKVEGSSCFLFAPQMPNIYM